MSKCSMLLVLFQTGIEFEALATLIDLAIATTDLDLAIVAPVIELTLEMCNE